jgi:signal peptidase I
MTVQAVDPIRRSGRHRPQAGGGYGRQIAAGAAWAVIVFACVVVFAAGILPRLLGAVPLAVMTGSMEPTYQPGTLVISRPVDPQTLKTGEVVTFQPISGDPTLETHRVVGLQLADGRVSGIITRGDANNVDDPPHLPAQIKGKVVYALPFLGYLSWAASALGAAWLLPALGAALLAYCAFALFAVFRPRRQRHERTGV